MARTATKKATKPRAKKATPALQQKYIEVERLKFIPTDLLNKLRTQHAAVKKEMGTYEESMDFLLGGFGIRKDSLTKIDLANGTITYNVMEWHSVPAGS